MTDWHTGISIALTQIFPDIESSQLARDWRRMYAPVLAEVEAGARPWALLDELHRLMSSKCLGNAQHAGGYSLRF
ncbi:hypothetical protein [Mycobacteroides chelonae]|uniref:hypothetical protein n=1 Tax=Mycobacteroides chelonae TaxID=1774 RepID=UPI001A959D71|nr:hypothetical protein [Mycobacteroides chelonae]